MSNTFTVRFEIFGDFVIEAESESAAERLAADSLIRWGGFGTVAENVQVDGVTIVDGMTEVQP